MARMTNSVLSRDSFYSELHELHEFQVFPAISLITVELHELQVFPAISLIAVALGACDASSSEASLKNGSTVGAARAITLA